MNADGSAQTQLSRANLLVNTLAWSPDGRFIAFTAVAGDLYIIGADGSGTRQLTRGIVVNSGPTWSSGGRTIFFSAATGPGMFNIFSVDIHGIEFRQLTADSEGGGSSPVLSPDGARVAFTAGADRDIFTMNADGSQRERLTTDSSDDANPSWSADGEWIVFDSNREGIDGREIFVMRADGSGQRRFTEGMGYNARMAVWAPGSVPRGDLYTTPQPSIPASQATARPGVTSSIDQPGLIRLTNNSIRDSDPTWSPDGKRIAYVSGSAPEYRIWTMNADGTDARVLSSEHVDGGLAWSPDGTNIAFVAFRKRKLRCLQPECRRFSCFTPH
jgi:Tol biopolymer transport system component